MAPWQRNALTYYYLLLVIVTIIVIDKTFVLAFQRGLRRTVFSPSQRSIFVKGTSRRSRSCGNDIFFASTSFLSLMARDSQNDVVESNSTYAALQTSGYHSKDGYSRLLSARDRTAPKRKGLRVLRRLIFAVPMFLLKRICRVDFFGMRPSFVVDPGQAHLSSIITENLMNSRGRYRREPGTLIMIRNGAATYSNTTATSNEDDLLLFLGWSDPNLSDIGLREVEHAARLLREAGYDVDVVFTSRLKRALQSTWAILKELDETYLPVFKSWRLNARCYGSLTNLSKAQVAAEVGLPAVQQWRTNPHATPPFMLTSDPRWPGRFRTYADVSPKNIPRGESLSTTARRVQSLWENKIRKELQVGHNVLVVGHGSTLLGLIQHIQGLTSTEVFKFRIPRGCPLVIEFDKSLKPIRPQGALQNEIWGTYLEKPGALEEALKREEEWKTVIPGYTRPTSENPIMMSSLERSLSKLVTERRELLLGELDNPLDFDSDFDAFDPELGDDSFNEDTFSDRSIVITSHPCLPMLLPNGVVDLPSNFQLPPRKGATIVMVRHGKTPHNQLGLFTGWEDPPLAPEGVKEAEEAGRLLKHNGFEFDVVYTSWLSRAIETAWLITNVMDHTWVPVIKSWRLNERMYGDLTGKSKTMVARQYGKDQFKLWRRGYKVRPPPVTSFSPSYPGNHKRYVRFMRDVPYSFRESLIRSLALGRVVLSRQFPKTESLQDCMKRTIPYLIHNIQPEAIDQGKRVLIASSENAIRGLLMYLCDIPEDAIASLNIPNGVPIIYDIRQKRVKLLDDGSGVDPLKKYDFGAAAQYLFSNENRPENDLTEEDEECDLESIPEEALKQFKIVS